MRRRIVQRLKGLKTASSKIRPIYAEKAVEWVQEKLKIELAAKQQEAILLSAASKVLVITGGPGTGKTTLITAVLRIFQQLKLRIFLGAPTGRAAKRGQGNRVGGRPSTGCSISTQKGG
jgi:exodeoxyribonuclease V alpha subunit